MTNKDDVETDNGIERLKALIRCARYLPHHEHKELISITSKMNKELALLATHCQSLEEEAKEERRVAEHAKGIVRVCENDYKERLKLKEKELAEALEYRRLQTETERKLVNKFNELIRQIQIAIKYGEKSEGPFYNMMGKLKSIVGDH